MAKNLYTFFIFEPLKFGHGIKWVLLTFFLLMVSSVVAQAKILASPPAASQEEYPKIKVSPSMAIVIGCLISSFFLMGCISIYVRQCAERGMLLAANVDNRSGWRTRRQVGGLDVAIIDTFPIFVYSDVKELKIGKGSLECAVCLNEFEGDETLRLLPKCSHVFHPECIDPWLASRTTCPVCRTTLIPKPEETPGSLAATAGHVSNDDEPVTSESDRSIETIGSVHAGEDANSGIQEIVVSRDNEQAPNHEGPRRSSLTKGKEKGTEEFPRSHSTGHSSVQPGENYERYTLRLPQEVRNRLMNSRLSRTKSCVAFPRERSVGKGFRSDSERTGREGLDRWGLSVTPLFISRSGSARSPKVGGDDLMTTPKSLLKAVKSPFDRWFGGGEKDNGDERPFNRLRSNQV